MKTFWLTKSECTGCWACANGCPVSAIDLLVDDAGFEYPVISEACIDCDRCEKICQSRLSLGAVNLRPPTYAVNSLDEETRFVSTSGGAFSELSKEVLLQGGFVFGASYDRPSRIVHTFIESEDDLSLLRQSKYAQSSIGLSMNDVKDRLIADKKVLFCGTPCQVAGLKAFLGMDYDNLITVDFVCRGVNSPKALEAWLAEREQKHGSSVARIWFKYKEHGWKLSPRCTRLDYKDGFHEVLNQDQNLFMCGYLEQNLYMRPSCAQCDFKGDNRRSDITLGDFWGLDSELDDDKGTTLVLLNTEKGSRLFESARRRLRCMERPFSEIMAKNVCFRRSIQLNSKSETFFHDLDEMKFSAALKKNSRQKTVFTKIKQRISRGIGRS